MIDHDAGWGTSEPLNVCQAHRPPSELSFRGFFPFWGVRHYDSVRNCLVRTDF